MWDAELELWAKWVINCNVDYPGPRYAYTNFYQVQPVSSFIPWILTNEWVDEWMTKHATFSITIQLELSNGYN